MRYFNAYGPTEYSVCATIFEATDDLPADHVPIGRPIANTEVLIVDENLQQVPIGVAGEICLSGAGLARGYLNQAELTAKRFVNHPLEKGKRMYRTGDLGRWNEDGTITYLGRKDTQVKLRGYRIELSEVSATLSAYDPITNAYVTKVTDKNGTDHLVAYYTTTMDIELQDIKSYLLGRLPVYMLPSRIIKVDKFPVTVNGKIDTKALPDPFELAEGENHFIAPRNKIENDLIELWREILGDKKIGVTDNFFDLGGDSLKATMLVSKIEEHFREKIDMVVLFRNPTVEFLAMELSAINWVIKNGDNPGDNVEEIVI
jgi:acyl carrier protein